MLTSATPHDEPPEHASVQPPNFDCQDDPPQIQAPKEPTKIDPRIVRQELDLARAKAFYLARKCGLSADDAEDFQSLATIKILSESAKIFSCFRGESLLSTYIEQVVRNCLRDFHIARRGKWRPSALARELGPIAVELERLRWLEGRSEEDAFQILRQRWHRPIQRVEIDKLLGALPARSTRRWIPFDDVSLGRAFCTQALEPSDESDRETSRVHVALQKALTELEPVQRHLLQRHFGDGIPICRIANRVGISRRSAYSLKDRTLQQLRWRLQAEGISWRDARTAIEDPCWQLGPKLKRVH